MNAHVQEPVAVYENGERVENTAVSTEVNKFIIQLKKPYKFDGKEYTSIDLSAVENLTARDLTAAEKSWQAHGGSSFVPEVNLAYCFEVAAIATKMPLEFFLGLPSKTALAVKNTLVADFFTDTE